MRRKKKLVVNWKSVKDHLLGFFGALILYLILYILIVTGSGCKLLSKVEKSKKDSTSVSRSVEDASHTDNSKSSKEAEYERATYLFPRDTSVVNNHIYPTAIIYEKGKTQESEHKEIKDDKSTSKTDSTSVSAKEKQTETSAKLSGIELAVYILIGLIAWKEILYPLFKFIKTKIKIV